MHANKEMNSSDLIIMAKEPKIGSTKTRLCPPMKFGEAANFYEALLWDTINMTTGIKGIDLAIAISPPESADYFRKISPPKTHLIPLTCADIGECLMRVLDKLLEMGYLQVMALNADGPSLPPSYIQEAKESLDQHDLVLGPTEDGGYYLIGFKENYPDLFTGIDWSTNEVLEQTLIKADSLNLSVHLLPTWYDVDTSKDIQRLRDELKMLPPKRLIHSRKFLAEWF